MFDRRKTARTAADAEKIKDQAEAIQAVLAGAGARANVTAAQLAEEAKIRAALAKEWAGPHIEHGKDWAKPRVEKAWSRTQKKVGPQIEEAARKSLPVVDTAHDKLVDDLIPKVVAAVNAAAVATSAGADKARDMTSAKLAEIGHVKPPKKSHKVRNTLLWLIFGGLAAAAVQAWRRSTPKNDPWAEDPWEPAPGQEGFKARAEEFKGVVDDVRHELGDAAEAVGEAAGEAVARTRETGRRRRTSTKAAAGDDTTTTQAIDETADEEMSEKLKEQLASTAAESEDTEGAPIEATPEPGADSGTEDENRS